jgi:hypothetical protein
VAIAGALGDPGTYAQLRLGAERLSAHSSFDSHVRLLLQVFDEVVH